MNKEKKARIPLTAKLLILSLSVVLLSNAAIVIISYKVSAKGMTNSVYSQLDAISSDIANQIDAINQNKFQILHAIAEIGVLKDTTVPLADKQRELNAVAKSLGNNIQNVAFYDRDGNAITDDGRLLNFKTRPYFTEAISGKDYVSDPAMSTVTNSVLQYYSVPVYDFDKSTTGAIVMVISGNSMLETISKIDMGNGMHPAVINNKTKVSVANVNEGIQESGVEKLKNEGGLSRVLNNIFAGKEGIEDFVDPDLHQHLIVSYRKIANTDWTVFAVAPYDMYFAALKELQTSFIIVDIIVIIISIVLMTVFINLLVRPLKTVKTSITTIASGNADLTQRIPSASNDEIGDVVNGFNSFVEKLQGIVTNLQNSKTNLTTVDGDLQASTQDASASITEIISNIESVNTQILNQSNSVEETAGAVNQISSNIESLERMIESQAACVTQASAAVEQMIGNINSVNNSVGKMIESFTTLQEHSQIGFETQNNANEKIMRIDEQSKMLQDANIAIANIAEQTNLLAMNAAIEAAHAGEAGKGFAVVADEIRKLSETSTDQSKTIGSELQKIQETIQDVVAVSSETNTAFTSITTSISETSQIISQIKAAMEEQQIGSKQIIEALHSMNDSTSEVRSASDEMTEGNKHILTEVQRLQNATDEIKGSIEEMHIGATRINETGAALTTISGKMAENIKQIGDAIDLFKV